MFRHRRADFPDGFVFGTATSAYQIEGHGFGGAGPTHWDSFAATPGNVANAEDGALACDHFHRFGDDLKLVSDAGFDAYRFSTSWARILPEGTGTPNPEGLDYYDRLIDRMLELGINPALTLYHWELPQALADKGGWRNADLPKWFGDYAALVGERYGDRLWSASAINEPWCVAWLSHFIGAHAPGMRDIRAAARAVHHVLKSHGTAIQALRAAGVPNLGAVCNFEFPHAATDAEADVAAAARYDAIYNHMFLSPMFKGCYPDLVLEGLEPHLPDGWQDDFSIIGEPLDWCGLNYYTCTRIAAAEGPWPALGSVPGPLPKTQMDWEIFPEGLHHFLTMVARDYTGDLPLFITENGMANSDVVTDGTVQDNARIEYLNEHFDAARQAIAEGVPLKGYFIWSLLDNYEWSLGYDKRFGLVHVDFDSLERTPKASWSALRTALNGEQSAAE